MYILKHRTKKKLSNGKFYPLGATLKEGGVNFAIYSKHAKEVYLLLFHEPDAAPLPPSIKWYDCNLDSPDWDNPDNKTICFLVHATEPGMEKLDYFAVFNADHRCREVKLPAFEEEKKWCRIIDTSLESPGDFIDLQEKKIAVTPAGHYIINPRSVVIFVGK